jgi:ubiquinone/menaquinone biosynthesis C-methylase UbiE
MDATQMDFPDNTFDVVITNQDYEFVNDAQKLMDEIFRVLKPGGVCFFGARNKLTLLEGQYRIPFLAFLPQRVARVYLALLGRKRIFLANYKTYWELLQLCKKFILTDYTIAIIKNPRKFNFKQLQKYEILTRKIPTCLLTTFRWLIPNFIFVLQKPRD